MIFLIGKKQGQVQRYVVMVPIHLCSERLNSMPLQIILSGKMVLETWEI